MYTDDTKEALNSTEPPLCKSAKPALLGGLSLKPFLRTLNSFREPLVYGLWCFFPRSHALRGNAYTIVLKNGTLFMC